MPGLFHQPISRKQFLATSVKSLGVMGLAHSCGQIRAADGKRSVWVVLLLDTHISADFANAYRGFRPVENLQQVVPQVRAAGPDLAIIDGDAARVDGQRDDYRSLQKLLAPLAAELPIYIGLGNHDDRKNFFQVFPPAGEERGQVAGKHVALIERAGLRFIVLDSLMYVNKVAGLLGKAQRTWLEKFLATADDKPILLFVHHTLGDGDGDLLDVDRLFRIVDAYPQVKAIFYGHSHRYAFDQHEHIQLINLPAVGYNFSDDQPVGWVDARFTPEGGEFTLRAIAGNRAGDGQTKSVAWS